MNMSIPTNSGKDAAVDVAGELRSITGNESALGALAFTALGYRGLRVSRDRVFGALAVADPNNEHKLVEFWQKGQDKRHPDGVDAGFVGLKRLVEDRWEIHGDVLLRWTQVVPAASNVAGDPMGSFVNVREAKKAGRTVKSRNRHTEPVLYYSLNRQVTDKVSGRETLEHWGILRYNAAHANGGIATVDFEGPKGDVKLDKEPLREAFPTAFKVTMDLFTTADFTGFFQSVCDDELAIQFSDGARYFIPKGAANRVAAAIEAIADATGWNTGIMVNPVMDTPVQRAQQAHNLMEEYGRVLARVREWKDKLIGDDSTQERSRLKNIELMKRDLQMLDLYESMLGTQFAEVQKVRQTGEASLRDEIKNMLDLTELMQSIKGR